MFRGLFSPDNPVMRFFTWLGYVWLLNILWLVCSLPIITIGASTTALIYSCMKLRADEGYVFKNFFKSFKENLRQSTLIWLIYLLAGALIGIGLIFWNNYNIAGSKIIWGIVLAIGILYLISLMYVFAIQSKFVNTIKDTIKYSIIIPFTNIKETILLALIVAGVVAVNLWTSFIVNFITLNIGMSIIVYLMAVHYKTVFDKYIPKQDYPQGESESHILEDSESDESEETSVSIEE